MAELNASFFIEVVVTEAQGNIMTVLVTGGCGFIGTNFVNNWLCSVNEKLINVDKLSYAAVHETASILDPNYSFVEMDINQTKEIKYLLQE